MATVAGRFELGRHNRPATILRELEESRPPGALLRFVRLAALSSLRCARPPAAEAEAPPHTTRRGASIADEVQLTLEVCAPREWGPPQIDHWRDGFFILPLASALPRNYLTVPRQGGGIEAGAQPCYGALARSN